MRCPKIMQLVLLMTFSLLAVKSNSIELYPVKNEKTQIDLLTRLAVHLEAKTCPLDFSLGGTDIRSDYSGLKITNWEDLEVHKKVYDSKVLEEAFPARMVSYWKNRNMTDEQVCKRLRLTATAEIPKLMSVMPDVKKLVKQGTKEQKINFLRNVFEFLEYAQKRCGVSEQHTIRAQVEALSLFEIFDNFQTDPQNAMNCPWEMCTSENGSSRMLAMMKYFFTAMSITLIYCFVKQRHKKKNRRISAIEIQEDSKRIHWKQKTKIYAIMALKVMFIMADIVLITTPTTVVQDIVCKN